MQIGEAALQFRNSFFGAAFATKSCSGIMGEPGLKLAPLVAVLLQFEFQLIFERTAAVVQRMADALGRMRLDMPRTRLDQTCRRRDICRSLGMCGENPTREERADDEQ